MAHDNLNRSSASAKADRFPRLANSDLCRAAPFFGAIAGLSLLALTPEAWLFYRGYDDIKTFASIAYYELIASAILWSPAFLLSRRWSRAWIIVVATISGFATLCTGFQAFSVGARWDSTTHAAVMETNPFEAWGFIRAFLPASTVSLLSAVLLGFVLCATVAVRATAPRRTVSIGILVLTFILSAYGISHAIRYGGSPIHRVQVSADTSLCIVDAGVNSYHPVLRLVTTHWNYLATHEYRAKMLGHVNRRLAELQGATVVRGATPPRILLVVIGESASRRHWSLYGYPRETTPELAKLDGELMVFRDTVCHTVGTLTEIQGMMCAEDSLLPTFALFAFAGYKTHWLSAQLDQGPNDVKMAALVQSCEERVFLNGAFDENLVPLIRSAIAEPGKQLIVVNLFGSHVRYDDRYPERFAIFRGDDEKSQRIATYDNSIRYTDHVLAEMIRSLESRHEATCFLYLSDHAEDVYDSTPDRYLFRSDSVATDAMYEIPMVAWVSPEYQKGNPRFVQAMIAAENKPFQSLGLYHSLIDLARIRHPIFDSHRSLFASDYVPKERHVGAAERAYHPGEKAVYPPAPKS